MVLGAAAGALAGLLVAPRTGRETRRILKKSADALPEIAEDLTTTVQIQADRLSESTSRSWDVTLLRLKEALAVGLDAAARDYRRTALTESDERTSSSSPSPSRSPAPSPSRSPNLAEERFESSQPVPDIRR